MSAGLTFLSARFNLALPLAVCLLACLTATAQAQEAGRWRQLAPIEGGTINALIGDGGRVYAATGGHGIFVSTDNGQTWREANGGISNPSGRLVFALAAAGGNVLAATSGGIYRTNDGGQNWTEALGGASVRSLIVTSGGVFAGGAGTGRVYRSTDNGQSWTERGVIRSRATVYAFGLLNNTLFAGSSNGVFRSTDQGQSWTVSNVGGAGNEIGPNPIVYALIVNGNDLYIGTEAYIGELGRLPQVYTSKDNGQSWENVGAAIRLPFANIPTPLTSPAVRGLLFDGGNLVALTDAGIAIYDGQFWYDVSPIRGLPVGVSVRALIIHGAAVLAGTSGGVFRLDIAKQSWVANNTGLAAADVVTLAVNGNFIFAGAGASGLFRSDNDGQSWTRLGGIDDGAGQPFSVTKLVVRGNEIFAGSRYSGVFRSVDGGANWKLHDIGFETPPSVPELAVGDGNVYALNFGALYKLNAAGNEWARPNPQDFDTPRLGRVAVSGGNIYATGGDGVLRSTNGGVDFTQAPTGRLFNLLDIAARGSNVYVSAFGASNVPRVYVSTDNGASFTPSQSIVRFVNAFAFKGNTIYAGTMSEGVFYSINNGINWTPINEGLLNRTVNALAVKGDMLLAGVNGYGVFAALNPEQQPATLASVSAASFRANGELAPASIASAFGTNLAPTTVAANATPLPTALAGTHLIVRDSAGVERDAPLFFASTGQINYQVPPATALGNATVIAIGDGRSSFGDITVAPVAPGLFSANGSGQGVAAAIALRVKPDGRQIFEPVSQFDPAQNKIVPLPIDLGPDLGNASDQIFLILYGTGVRFRSSLSTVTASIGGIGTTVLFAGEAEGFVGLDQINLFLPRNLAGRGDVEIKLSVDGKAANTVTIRVK